MFKILIYAMLASVHVTHCEMLFTLLFNKLQYEAFTSRARSDSCREMISPPWSPVHTIYKKLPVLTLIYFFQRWCIREDINGKKTFSFGHCPNEGRGGGLPRPKFFGPLSKSAFLVNKKSLFLQRCQCIELLTDF